MGRVAWLLETLVALPGQAGTRTAYFKGKMLHSSLPEYTFDVGEAYPFSSKEDAEAHNHSPWHHYTAVEHVWSDV